MRLQLNCRERQLITVLGQARAPLVERLIPSGRWLCTTFSFNKHFPLADPLRFGAIHALVFHSFPVVCQCLVVLAFASASREECRCTARQFLGSPRVSLQWLAPRHVIRLVQNGMAERRVVSHTSFCQHQEVNGLLRPSRTALTPPSIHILQ